MMIVPRAAAYILSSGLSAGLLIVSTDATAQVNPPLPAWITAAASKSHLEAELTGSPGSVRPEHGADLQIALAANEDRGQASAGPVRLTLAEALARGTAVSHRLEELRAREAGATAAVGGRAADDRPMIALTGGYVRYSHIEEFGILQPNGELKVVFPDIPDNFRARLGLQWSLYSGGRIASLERAATSDLEAAQDDTAAAANDLRLEITQAFWGIVTAAAQVDVLEQAVNRMDAHLAAVRGQFDAGLVPPNDVLTVEAERARQQLLLLQARNARAVLETEMRRLTGVDHDRALVLDASLDPPPSAPSPVGELTSEALRARPERQALTNRVSSLSARREAATAGKRPQIGLAGGVDYAHPNLRVLPPIAEWQESWDIGVNASWSLWDGGRTDAEIAEAAAATRAAQQRLAEFDSRLEVEVRQRRLDLESALAAIGVTATAVQSAAEARRVVANRFEAGVIRSLDVVDAQVALLQAELDRTRALAAAQLAQARLEHTVGR